MNLSFPQFNTLEPLDRLTSSEVSSHNRGFSLDEDDKETEETSSTQGHPVVSAISSLQTILQRNVT